MKNEKFPPLMTGTVQAGFPSPAEHYIERELDLNDYLAANRDAVYYVRVKGESMIGANIFPEISFALTAVWISLTERSSLPLLTEDLR